MLNWSTSSRALAGPGPIGAGPVADESQIDSLRRERRNRQRVPVNFTKETVVDHLEHLHIYGHFVIFFYKISKGLFTQKKFKKSEKSKNK